LFFATFPPCCRLPHFPYTTLFRSGDDVEHPMLMKWLIVACIVIGKPLGWAPETMTRLPNALAGGLGSRVIVSGAQPSGLPITMRSEEHTSELQSPDQLV